MHRAHAQCAANPALHLDCGIVCVGAAIMFCRRLYDFPQWNGKAAQSGLTRVTDPGLIIGFALVICCTPILQPTHW